MEPCPQSIDVITWSGFNHDELKKYGKEYRNKNQQTYLNRYRDNIIGCFGVSPSEMCELKITKDKYLVLIDKKGNRRFEDGSYLSANDQPSRISESRYLHKHDTCEYNSRGECILCYKYECCECLRRFNGIQCPYCKKIYK